jgi:hypothetical protein
LIAPIIDQHILVIIYARFSNRGQESALRFDLNAILNCVDKMRAVMPPTHAPDCFPRRAKKSAKT